MSLGKTIKQLRKEHYLTQEELAEKLNVTFQAVSKWENETGMPDISQIVPLARIFGVSTDELFGIQEDEEMQKEKCFHVIRRIVELAQLTRKKGLLSMELEIPEEQSVFLKTGIQLAIDSYDPEKIREILQNLITAGNYSGLQLLEKQLMMEGIIEIINGNNPYAVAFQLLSMLGEKYLARVGECWSDDNKNKPYVDLMNAFKDKEATPESAAFDKKLIEIDRWATRTIYRKINSIDPHCLPYALYGCSIELICKFLDDMSQNQCMDLCEQLLQIDSIESHKNAAYLSKRVQKTQDKMIEVIEDLVKAGYMVIRDS